MIPALKVAKLAVDESFSKKYKGIGKDRFLSVDADIEHNTSVLDFYKKNGFLLNEELYNKNRKTVSMRKDIY
jgi:hypothetical protein